jgi:hypothetical protein
MPYVERREGVVVGLYANAQPGYAEEFLADDDAEVIAFQTPAPAAPHLNGGGLARFTGTLPVAVLEAIHVTGATRVAKGRYRVTHEVAMPSDQYSAIPAVFDANPRSIRITARTASYVEVRVTDNANAAQDAAEITVETKRVITP